MTTARQLFRNDTAADLIINLEPWCWRYRLRPGDVFELTYALECSQPNWAPLEINFFTEANTTELQVFVNGNSEPEMRINGALADQDYRLP